jgi:hypothetical protein
MGNASGGKLVYVTTPFSFDCAPGSLTASAKKDLDVDDVLVYLFTVGAGSDPAVPAGSVIVGVAIHSGDMFSVNSSEWVSDGSQVKITISKFYSNVKVFYCTPSGGTTTSSVSTTTVTSTTTDTETVPGTTVTSPAVTQTQVVTVTVTLPANTVTAPGTTTVVTDPPGPPTTVTLPSQTITLPVSTDRTTTVVTITTPSHVVTVPARVITHVEAAKAVVKTILKKIFTPLIRACAAAGGPGKG